MLFSALATGSSFGGLAVSNHPGTASMGIVLLGLAVVLATIFTLMPSLMGPPPAASSVPETA